MIALLLLCLFGFVKSDCNEEMDNLITNITNDDEIRREFQPADLGTYWDENTGTSVWDIKLYGLLFSLKRHGECELNFDDNDISVKSGLIAYRLDIHSSYQCNIILFNILNVIISGKIHIKIGRVESKMTLLVELPFEESELKSFNITRIEDFKVVSLTGFTYLFNWLAKYIFEVKIKSMFPHILHSLQEKIKKLVNDNMEKFSKHFVL
ncbi:uncharacterized protein LOC111612616 [Centruroides sculpturatus]|uniref:uncharacterized protein LOC111612616 n=1 Tax=Centruroides sculpturatus TaxID=218467 RepID=UPI000C6E9605|nr:uncharacterized protein LOC111612616 [Centruroides sculpturatus]